MLPILDEGALGAGGIPGNCYTMLSPICADLANLVILRLDFFLSFLLREKNRIRRGRNYVLGSCLHFLYGKGCYQYKLEPPIYQL